MSSRTKKLKSAFISRSAWRFRAEKTAKTPSGIKKFEKIEKKDRFYSTYLL